jgi:Flp pilus assembly protein TadD
MIVRRTLAIWLCLTGGCAVHRSPSVTEHFVKNTGESAQGGATFDVPRDSSDPKRAKAESSAPPPVSLPSTPTPKLSDMPTIEKQDGRLAAALDTLAARPSGAAHRAVAAEYLRLSIFDAAYDHLAAALQIDPRDFMAYEALARLWRDAGLPALSLSPAYRAVYLAPNWAEAENTLGTVLYALGNPDAARVRFTHALSLDPVAGYVLNNLCYMSLVGGDLSRARAECDEAVRLAPELRAARMNSAAVLAAAGR